MSNATTHIKTEKRSAERSRSKLVPALRFSEFEGEWNPSKLGAVTKYVKGFAFKSDDYQDNGVRIIRVSDLAADRIKTDNDKLYIDEQKALDFDKYKLRTGNIVITTVGSKPEMIESAVGRGIYIHNDDEGLLNQNMLKFENIEGISNGFIIGLINSRRYQHYMKGIARGNANQANITVVDLLQYNISCPQLPEQQKIASFLSAVDEKIQQLTKKKALLEQYKKGVMQQLFPSTGSGQRSGQLRFKDANGKAYPDWEDTLLGDCLKYVQPTKYLVSSTEYDNSFETPVLTAGKTFVLGYTDEKENICTDYPLIIFDDFTTASKYVDFPFKAKSSAMKLLLAKEGVDVKFMFEAMQNIKFEVGGHGRHWISIFSQLVVSVPSINEQQKIATYLSSIDNKIEAVNNQITQTQTFKKGLLQQMFV